MVALIKPCPHIKKLILLHKRISTIIEINYHNSVANGIVSDKNNEI